MHNKINRAQKILNAFHSKKASNEPIPAQEHKEQKIVDGPSTIDWSMHPLNNSVNRVTGHYQCVMQEDAVDV